MPAIGHCQHCWGDCLGNCLLPGTSGACIHRLAARRQLWRLLGRRGWWRRVFWGIR